MGSDAGSRSEVIEEKSGRDSRKDCILRADSHFQERTLPLHSSSFWEFGACGDSWTQLMLQSLS